ncbi:MAG: GntR family transcriptional regulator [Lachnospiraceae bacterium]
MFQIDLMSRKPVYEQLVEQTERFILTGILNAGDRMPSVRSLSMTLSVNPNTVQKAISELDSRGLIQSVPGRGCFVSADAKEKLSNVKRGGLEKLPEQIKELALAGVTRLEVIDCVNQVFNDLEGK